MATEAEIAWAAGIFEGEGCITWAVKPGLHRMPSPHLIVNLARERSCLRCGNVFMANMVKQVCCSDLCNSRHQKARQRDPRWVSAGPRGHGART